jgi:hypothetical protein
MVDAIGGVALLLALGACAMFALALRRWFLTRRGGIDVSMRTRVGPGARGWLLGVAKYSGDDLLWFRVFSVLPGPTSTLSRRVLEVVGRRAPDGPESWSVQVGAVILECRHAGQPVQLAMDIGALTGFLSWLEATPPEYPVSGYAAG